MKEEITEIVTSILQTNDVDPDKDLFGQGATSLAYVRIVTEINNRFGLSLNGSEVDGLATVNRLTDVVAAAQSSAPTNA